MYKNGMRNDLDEIVFISCKDIPRLFAFPDTPEIVFNA
jgi:hypothetical protein